MRLSRIAGIAAVALITITPSALAQTKAKSDDKTATQTFTGCLMSDVDYQRAHKIGEGSPNEFVLVDVKISPATAPSSDAAGATSASAGTCADQGLAYRLRSSAQDKLTPAKLRGLVGHQLEIRGRYEHADDVTAAGTQKPSEKLPPEVDVVSVREAPAPAAAAAAPVTEPAPPTMPPPPPASTVQPAPAPTPAAPAPTELPHSASSSGLLAAIGLLALSSGVVLTLRRHRLL